MKKVIRVAVDNIKLDKYLVVLANVTLALTVVTYFVKG